MRRGRCDEVGFAAAISHARMRLSRLGRILVGHAGRIAGRRRVGAVVPPFLSPTLWEQHAGVLGGGAARGRSRWRHGPGTFWLSWPDLGAGGSRCGLLVALPAI